MSVELDISESLIVINTLAVKRAELRGGAWSSAGKQVEKRLMESLCELYQVPRQHYDLTGLTDEGREVDFYLIDNNQKKYKCEVKLMGKGNPESADATIARSSDIFIADKLSNLNKDQLDSLGIEWIELRSEQGYKKFNQILSNLHIPHIDFDGDVEQRLTEIFSAMFQIPTSDVDLLEE